MALPLSIRFIEASHRRVNGLGSVDIYGY